MSIEAYTAIKVRRVFNHREGTNEENIEKRIRKTLTFGNNCKQLLVKRNKIALVCRRGGKVVTLMSG